MILIRQDDYYEKLVCEHLGRDDRAITTENHITFLIKKTFWSFLVRKIGLVDASGSQHSVC